LCKAVSYDEGNEGKNKLLGCVGCDEVTLEISSRYRLENFKL